MNPRRWLAALSFPFLILAAVLVYEAWTAQRGFHASMPPWKTWLHYSLAGVFILLAMLGARERHRRHD
ncbi:MAG: hypothetical protein ACHRHE_13480 [Tepidisphaerales bacterium]